jgi:hypothetical protein
MIISNSKVEKERLKGIKVVKFIFLVIDGRLQDGWGVICAKSEISKSTSQKSALVAMFGFNQMVLDAFPAS